MGISASQASLCSKCKADDTSSTYILTIVPKTLCTKITINNKNIARRIFVPAVFLYSFPFTLMYNASCICASIIAKNKCIEILACARLNFTTIAPNNPVSITPIKNASASLKDCFCCVFLKNKSAVCITANNPSNTPSKRFTYSIQVW